jgi:hypothetical protein
MLPPRIESLETFFCGKKYSLIRTRIRNPESFCPGIRDEKIRIRDKHPGYATPQKMRKSYIFVFIGLYSKLKSILNAWIRIPIHISYPYSRSTFQIHIHDPATSITKDCVAGELQPGGGPEDEGCRAGEAQAQELPAGAAGLQHHSPARDQSEVNPVMGIRIGFFFFISKRI